MAEYALGAFLARWYPTTHHDLAASDSETWRISELLALASPEGRAGWDNLALGYTDPRGAGWLRARISEGYDSITADAIVCFAGAQEGLSIALQALLAPGDHAIMLLPAYQPSEIALTSLCDTTGIALDATKNWSLDLDRVEQAIRPQTRVILANFPNNPTGKLPSADEFADLLDICRRHDLWLVNDEVYRLIDRAPSQRLPCVADAYDKGVSVDALSKSFGLPGLRVGWLACRDQTLLTRLRSLKQIASLCLSGPSEVLAHIALGARETILERNRAIATANLDAVNAFLAAHRNVVDWHEPEGGAIGYVRYRGSDGVEAFATRMASEARTLVLPASVWRSALTPLPTDRFRIGFGRRDCSAGLSAISHALGRVRTAA